MCRDLNVADVLISFGINESDFAVVLSSILPAVAHIKQVFMQVLDYAIGTQVQLDGVKQFKVATTEDAQHPVVSACDKHLIHGWHVGDTLGLFEPWNAARPLARLQVHYFHGPFSRPATKRRLPFTSTSMWSRRPLTFGMGIVCTNRKGSFSCAPDLSGEARKSANAVAKVQRNFPMIITP